MARRRVTYNFNALAPSWVNGNVDSVIYETLTTQFLDPILSVNSSVVNSQFYAVQMDINLSASFNGYDIGNEINRILSADGWVISSVTVTDSGIQQAQQTQIQNPMPMNTSNSTVYGMTHGAIKFLGNYNGIDIYKDDLGCFYYDSAWGGGQVPVDTTCPSSSSDWFASIGNMFGFGNQSSSLGKLGITAAAGGAVVLFVALLLITKGK